jgi:zinc/manganese transport system substrate-binding protein
MIAMLLVFVQSAWAGVDVVATLPWLGSVAHEVAPDASITVLARGTEDPHFLSPTPALMAKVGQADLYIENGMNLELWSERLIDGAGNPDIRPGQKGYVKATDNVPRLEVPADLSRAHGDMHPEGNPHVWSDPLNAAIAADNIAAGLGRVDPDNAATYVANAKSFRAKIDERLFGKDLVDFMGADLLERMARTGKLQAFLESKGLTPRLGGWLKDAASLHGKPVVFYHQSWAYFIDRYQIDTVGYIEDRPGISPSAAHRDELAAAMKAKSCKTIVIDSYYDDRLAQVLGQEVGAKVVVVPGDVGGVPDATDYFTYMDFLVHNIGAAQ